MYHRIYLTKPKDLTFREKMWDLGNRLSNTDKGDPRVRDTRGRPWE